MNEIIEKLEKKCFEWSNKFQSNGIKIAFNKRLTVQKIENIKYIIVGDNPGNDEEVKEEYLVGEAGLITRLFFERFFVDNFDNEVLTLNKTPISTATTDKLKEVNSDILKETQEFMADIVMELHGHIKVPVIIVGFSGCRKTPNGSVKWLDSRSSEKGATGKHFFSQLKKNYRNSPLKETLLIVKHFSRNCFFEDFKIENYRRNDLFEIFRIGSEYRKELIK